jgi:penicillin-insensitive murein DD-endopeptidase
MRTAGRLLAVLVFAAAIPAIAQEKHLIDPTPPGSLNPEPLPPLQNPDAQSTPAKELFARKPTPFPGPPRSIGGYSDGCLAGATQLPNNGPSWQVMRPSRNRNWGNPHLIRFIERFAKNAKKVGWRGLLVGDMSQPRGGVIRRLKVSKVAKNDKSQPARRDPFAGNALPACNRKVAGMWFEQNALQQF